MLSNYQYLFHCRPTLSTFFNLSFPHIYIIFIFPILGSLNFLSWGPLHFRLGAPTYPGPVADLLFHLSFPHIHSFHLSYLGAVKFSILGTTKFPFGSPKISGPSGRLAVELPIPFSLYTIYIIFIFPFHIYILFIFPILGPQNFLSWGPLNFRLGFPKSLAPVADLLSNYQYLFHCTSSTFFYLYFSYIVHNFHLSYIGSPNFLY